MFFIIFKLKLNCRLEDSTLILEDEGPPFLPLSEETSDTADTEVDGPEKEEDLVIFQVLERLEELTNVLTNRSGTYIGRQKIHLVTYVAWCVSCYFLSQFFVYHL